MIVGPDPDVPKTCFHHVYDGLNRRIKKINDTVRGHRYYYNTDWQILEGKRAPQP